MPLKYVLTYSSALVGRFNRSWGGKLDGLGAYLLARGATVTLTTIPASNIEFWDNSHLQNLVDLLYLARKFGADEIEIEIDNEGCKEHIRGYFDRLLRQTRFADISYFEKDEGQMHLLASFHEVKKVTMETMTDEYLERMLTEVEEELKAEQGHPYDGEDLTPTEIKWKTKESREELGKLFGYRRGKPENGN